MNSSDAVVCVGLVIAVVTGFNAGLLRSAVTILAYLIAMPITVWVMSLVSSGSDGKPGSPWTQNSLLFFGIFLVSGMVLGKLMRMALDETIGAEAGLGDRLAGAALGAVRVGNLIKWPKGAIVRAVHEGVGLSRMWFAAAQRKGVEIRYASPAIRLMQDNRGRVTGVIARDANGVHELSANAVVLGCGGFEANAAWRAQYLGRPWDHAKVRGTPHNQADGLRMALEIGAMPWGQWSGCHATPINAGAPAFGDRQLTDKTNRLSYPYGVMLNRLGQRFVDEGEDQALFTYAKFGGIILNQPGGVAYQIFDAKVKHLLEPRYETSEPATAISLDDLMSKLDLDREAAIRTLEEYNLATGHGSFNPGDRDGMTTCGLTPPKSNWAQKLDTPPYLAWPVTGGITFSFGGLKVNDRAQVIGTDWNPIAGLYTCGEMVGGLFHHNYPGGSGLMSGAVFGRIAGANAADERG